MSEKNIFDLITLDDIKFETEKSIARTEVVDQVFTKVMTDGVHFGKIPGTDKPTLFKAGADKLVSIFRLKPKFETVEKVVNWDVTPPYYELRKRCVLIHYQTGYEVGEGTGSANSWEKRYRYRSQNTGREVPEDYWKSRDANLLGGLQFSPRKVKNKWMIFEQIANEDIADMFNTIEKMSDKRALIAAILTATGTSDRFTQDVEDLELGDQAEDVRTQAKETAGTVKEKPSKGANPSAEDAGAQESASTDKDKGKDHIPENINVKKQIEILLDELTDGTTKAKENLLAEVSVYKYEKDGKPKTSRVETLDHLRSPAISDIRASYILDALKERESIQSTDPEGCKQNPDKCMHSGYLGDRAICIPLGNIECKYQKKK